MKQRTPISHFDPTVNPWGQTNDPIAEIQPVVKRKRRSRWGCCCLIVPLVLVLLVAASYLLAPQRTNLVVLGIDRTPEGTDLGRSDTIILMTVVPLKPYVGMLSIPRDLWLPIPGQGENRINTAHFFAEIEQPGSGPDAARQVIQDNFGLTLPYYVRFRFSTFQEVVEAMGGVTVNLDAPTAGYDPGQHRLNGEQALAFVRDRKGTDDFFRMAHGQLFLKAMTRQMLNPLSWPRLPGIASVVFKAMDTNVPIWQWPRIGLALVRAGPEGFDSRTLTREEVTPITTDGGANVLLPNWDRINPILMEMFGE